MACFLAPMAEAIATTAVKKHVEKKEKELAPCEASSNSGAFKKTSFSQKLKWLNTMLWGGCFLLCIEHIWHGEVVPWPPFLTAINNPTEVVPMLMEILTVGVAMSVFITVVWGIMVLVSNKIEQAKVKSVSREV